VPPYIGFAHRPGFHLTCNFGDTQILVQKNENGYASQYILVHYKKENIMSESTKSKIVSIKPVEKEVFIMTGNYRVKGFISLLPNERQTDFLLNARPFVAVTNAELFDINGCELLKAPFVNVHRDHIQVISPVEDGTDFSETNTCQIVI